MIKTEIFHFEVTDCKPISNFDPYEYGRKGRRGADIQTEKVAYIVWGHVSDCMSIVNKIPISNKHDPLVDDIEAISIVSLSKVIQMAKYAANFLQ
jgi:hypothetical protein